MEKYLTVRHQKETKTCVSICVINCIEYILRTHKVAITFPNDIFHNVPPTKPVCGVKNGLRVAVQKGYLLTFGVVPRNLDTVRGLLLHVPVIASVKLDNGEHAITLVSYDAKKKSFKFLNSWGDKWKNRGYHEIEPEYITDRPMYVCTRIKYYNKVYDISEKLENIKGVEYVNFT
jgi:hypothetical protein